MKGTITVRVDIRTENVHLPFPGCRGTAGCDCPAILKTIKQRLHDRFEIAHATIEMETEADQCDPETGICFTH